MDFYTIYIREAHPLDGWRLASNDRAGVLLKQPRTNGERESAARSLCEKKSGVIPVLLDGLDDATAAAYAAFPERLYLIDRSGRVAYKGGRGPICFDTRSLEDALILTLLEERHGEAQGAGLRDRASPR